MSRRPLARLGAGLLLGAALTLAAGGAAHGADPHDIPLTVQVTSAPTTNSTSASTSTSTSTGSAGIPRTGGSGSAVNSSAAVVAGAVPTSSPSAPAGTETVGGVLAVGGLITSYSPSRNPLVGTVRVQMTVQNLSSEVIAPTVGFWLTNAVGTRLSQQDVRGLGAIAPGELRVAEADLTGVGQWAAVDVHMKLTPPAQIGGVAIDPLTRDRWVFAPPWFVVVALVLSAGILAAWRWSARVPAARVAVEAAS